MRLRTTFLLTLLLSRYASAADWPQAGYDSSHSGTNPHETTIHPGNVGTLHARYQVSLPSIADGMPAFLESVATPSGTMDLLFLNTKDGRILALNAANGALVWSKQPATGPNYTTSSPAIDPGRQYVYAYALDGKVHKYAVGDGAEVLTGWPQVATLKPSVEKGASALAIATTANGTFLYVAHGGYPGDAGDYQGHVTAINVGNGAQKVFNAACSDRACHFALNGSGDCSQAHPDCSQVQSGIWARGGVAYSAALDRIFFATGNGRYDANTGGRNWGDSILAIHPDGSATSGLPLDSYTPTEFQILQNDDADLGSTSLGILPTVSGSPIAHLGVQSQKVPGTSPYTTSRIRLLDLSNMSGQGGPGHVAGELQNMAVPQGGAVFAGPAVWTNPADGAVWVFYANGNGISGLKVVVSGGHPSLVTQWTTGRGGTSPVIANGILYYVGSGGLLALNPLTGGALWSDNGAVGGIHWESPIVVNGRVYVTDQSSRLWAFEPVSAPPFGYFDTPASGTTAVEGAIAVTGWALDAVGVSRLELWRDWVKGDPAPAPNGKIYIGDATFVAGTRPDVQAAYPGYPNANRAGWGYMLLTNVLPNTTTGASSGGVGTFTLYAYIDSVDGNVTALPPHTFTCNNTTATRPFGTIDTPTQGQTVSGTLNNFGWVLTPGTAKIPIDGSTIQLYIDGVLRGNLQYNLPRSDIQTLFPGYTNTSGPVGFRSINTTTLANGVHTIHWIATDNQGRAQGIGSRYFTVQN